MRKVKRTDWKAAHGAESAARKKLIADYNETLRERDRLIGQKLRVTATLNAERGKLARACRSLAAMAEYLDTIGKGSVARMLRADAADLAPGGEADEG